MDSILPSFPFVSLDEHPLLGKPVSVPTIIPLKWLRSQCGASSFQLILGQILDGSRDLRQMWSRFHPQCRQQMILHERKSAMIHVRNEREITGDIQFDKKIINQSNSIRCWDDEMLLVTLVAQVRI
jgi:hypothetical protein